MEELWKPIKGFEGVYDVSSFGRVKNKKKQTILKPCDGGIGYLHVCLRRRTIKVHKAVAEAFLQKTEGKPIINHKDGNKQNNHASNLEYCTQKDNIRHAITTGLMKPLGGDTRSKAVIQYDLSGNFVKYWRNAKSAIVEGFRQSQICLCCQGKITHYKGFIWRYSDTT
jgi:hypothetical protein